MKKLFVRTALAASAALMIAGAANATVTVTFNSTDLDAVQDTTLVPELTLLYNFDGIAAPGYTYSGGTATSNDPGITREPLLDTSVYGWVTPGNSPAIFTTTASGLTSFSLLVGSPDTYNRIVFYDLSHNVIGDMTGSTGLFGTFAQTNGADIARRFTYSTSNGQHIGEVDFYSTQNAFEFDRIAGVVPEPATWAMMLVGFFGLGATLRSRKLAPRAI